MKISKDEYGLAHIAIIVVVVVIVAIGAVGYRVMGSDKSGQNKLNDMPETSKTSEAEKVTINEENLSPVVGDVDAPEGEQEISQPVKEVPVKKNSAKTIKFVKGGIGIDGSSVIASATSNSNLDGRCYFTFALGNSKVNFSNKAAGKECWVLGHISSFPKSGTWEMSVKYVSNDGATTGSISGYSILIIPKPRTISFTKGGASQVASGAVSASSILSEKVSGTCTFSFSLNGSVRVKRTTTIVNSNKCEDTNITGFPKSAEYSFTLSFRSKDDLIKADQGAFGVAVSY